MENFKKILISVFLPLIILNILFYFIGDNDGTGLGIGLLPFKVGSIFLSFLLLQFLALKVFTESRKKWMVIANLLFILGFTVNIQVFKTLRSQATANMYEKEYQGMKNDPNGAAIVFIQPVNSKDVRIDSPLYIEVYVRKDLELLSEFSVFLRSDDQVSVAQTILKANGHYSVDGRRIFEGHLEFQIPKNNEWLEYHLAIDKIILGDQVIPGASLVVHLKE